MDKKTILHLPPNQASMWCLDAMLFLTDLTNREYLLLSDTTRLSAQSIEGMLYGDGRLAHGSPISQTD